MWRPGDAKPEDNPLDHEAAEVPTPSQSAAGDGNDINSGKTPHSSAKKKLSGLTMNMRFMKRKNEDDAQRRRRQSSTSCAMDIDGPDDERSPARHRAQHEMDSSGEESNDDDDDDDNDDKESGLPYSVATPSDMYGANFLGRRSFGGFNRPMEAAWNLSRRELQGKRAKSDASDQELLNRYKDYIDMGKRRSQSQIDHPQQPSNNSRQKRRRKTSLSGA